jgi:hypothetical protein
MNRYLVAAVLALLVLISAMSLKALTTHPVLANTANPVPPRPGGNWVAANTANPVPPTVPR